MGIRYLPISVATTVLSIVGLKLWTELSLDRLRADGIMTKNISLVDSEDALEPLLSSRTTIALLANFVLNVYILVVLSLKGTFLPLVVPPTVFQGVLRTIWLTVLCTLKMFQALARDRLERLNASPSSTPCTYFRVYSALFMVLSVDLLWIDNWFSSVFIVTF